MELKSKIVIVSLTGALLACAALALTPASGFLSAQAVDTQTTGSIRPDTHNDRVFVISEPGSEAGCEVYPFQPAAEKRGALRINNDCLNLYPALTSAVSWQQQPNGTIIFSDKSGETVLEFSEDDGPDYISIKPREVLLSLAELDRE